MKVYIIKDEDLEVLISVMQADPGKVINDIITDSERRWFDKAFRFYNYQIRNWIDNIKK
jgi:hypothetical protein